MEHNLKLPHYDVLLGDDQKNSHQDQKQYGIIGHCGKKTVALDLNKPSTISLFGVQGSGKSYSLGMIAEMASMQIHNINYLKQPQATVFFHYSRSRHLEPEFCSMTEANNNAEQLARLKASYGAEPKAFEDVIILTTKDTVDERKIKYPNIEVHPLKFASNELNLDNWKFLMGAIGNDSMYIRDMTRIMRMIRSDFTVESLESLIDTEMKDNAQLLAKQRLSFAKEYIDDGFQLRSLLKPGRLIIVDLRDSFVQEDEALGLFVVLLNIFSEAKYQSKSFNKLIIFDECHKYIKNQEMSSALIEIVREMRHTGTTVVIASQDPPSVPVKLIELSTIIFLHKFNAPSWLDHLKKANVTYKRLNSLDLSILEAGECYVWANLATDQKFQFAPVKIKCRPRVTMHGGNTQQADDEL